jgi:hypothetical protein
VSQTWAALLDAFEAEVDAAWSIESSDWTEPAEIPGWSAEAATFVPLTGLGPLPPALVERAVSLLQRMSNVQEHLERRQAEIGRELSALRAARAPATAVTDRPVPHFLDTTA